MKYIIQEIEKELKFKFPEQTIFEKTDEGVKVERKHDAFTVSYKNKRDILRAGLIIKTNQGLNEYSIEEREIFEDVCLMVDCSRNAVRGVESVKKLIRNIAMMGYNSLMLYMKSLKGFMCELVLSPKK